MTAKSEKIPGTATKSGTREVRISEKFAAKRRAWKRQPKELLDTAHQVILGDARDLGTLVKQPIHLIVTSPPYWDLKVYADSGKAAQLGHIHEREQFMSATAEVWRQCYDLLVPGGRLCIVVGDVCRSRKAHGRHVVEPLHAYLQVQCQEMGFDPLSSIIWHKIANMSTEVAGNGNGFLGKPYEPNAIIKNDIEYILLFRKPGGYRHPTQDQRDLSVIDKEDHKKWFRQIWADVPGEIQRGHPAPFPVEVARRLIGMYSFVGDIVLDPFLGTGTTTAAAIQMHRSSIGIELEPQYIDMTQKRIGASTTGTTIRYS